jgi:hypothetical protein
VVLEAAKHHVTVDAVWLHLEATTQRAERRLWLLVDLLEHEMLEASLHDGVQLELNRLDLARWGHLWAVRPTRELETPVVDRRHVVILRGRS